MTLNCPPQPCGPLPGSLSNNASNLELNRLATNFRQLGQHEIKRHRPVFLSPVVGGLGVQRERPASCVVYAMKGWRNVLFTSGRLSQPATDQTWMKSMPNVHGPSCLSATPVGPRPNLPAVSSESVPVGIKNTSVSWIILPKTSAVTLKE